ncbi:DUF421 domain-containing protein [Aurantimonas sp. A3-2-R12]|uniref:DUF421 domain-containing protein n=1 Tax=Aurantimonas sp. A3-2-R12 TaxID=3114362 RepID=UPI002E18E3CD|nr:YetF domain-containing protein [Aurantimonas sp. A3-2-R12]
MIFDSWYDLWQILVTGILAYAGLVLLLRTTGKRTLSKMNAFDLVVTVALGSILASVILNKDTSLSEGLFAFVLLCSLQYAVAWTSLRWKPVQNLVKAEPTLLFFDGRFLSAMLSKERVTEQEVLAAIRSQGTADLANVRAVVLETDGSFSVVVAPHGSPLTTLRHVQGSPDGRSPPSEV